MGLSWYEPRRGRGVGAGGGTRRDARRLRALLGSLAVWPAAGRSYWHPRVQGLDWRPGAVISMLGELELRTSPLRAPIASSVKWT